MSDAKRNQVFLSYSPENEAFVEGLARRLQGDARLSFWFGPWHSIPGALIQEQMEDALGEARSCAVFISGAGEIAGWQNEQMRAAIAAHVEDDPRYRVIPVLLPGATRPSRKALPRFLRNFEPVEFRSLDDEQAFKRLLAGILGVPPVQVEGYVQEQARKEQQPPPPSGRFEHGHALVIGIARYTPPISPLPATVVADARAVQAVLTDPAVCGYPPEQVTPLLDEAATGAAIRAELRRLAGATGPDDTAVIFFSGHGGRERVDGGSRQYIIPVDCDVANLAGTAISGEEMTELLRAIPAGRLLVLFDACHSGGAGDPKSLLPTVTSGLSEDYYEALARGRGRVVIASSRPEELSWVLHGMNNSVFTYYLLEALRGQGRTLGDGYVRVFDLFRHVADHVPAHADQHPIFKATAMEEDFPVALTSRV